MVARFEEKLCTPSLAKAVETAGAVIERHAAVLWPSDKKRRKEHA
jgi:hypothetical protein